MTLAKQFLFLLAGTLFLAACGNAPEGQKVGAGDAVDAGATEGLIYKIDPAQSSLIWKAGKLIGGGHEGTLAIKSGEIAIAGGKITGGEFIVDMNSLTNADLAPGEGKEDLETHLKSSEFFDAALFPEGKFTIASATEVSGVPGATHNVTGNLTLKDVTKSVVIPVSMKFDDNNLEANTPAFVINRTDWGVKYGSGLLGTPQDKIIKDEVGLEISLVARK